MHLMLGGYRQRLLLVAFQDWCEDTRVEAALSNSLVEKRETKRMVAVGAWLLFARNRRRQQALLRRAKSRSLEATYRHGINGFLRYLERKYNAADKLKACHKYYLDYHKRVVLYNLLFLRRNRIAYQFRVAKKFKLLVSCMRARMVARGYFRRLLAVGSRVIMRKLFQRWLGRAKGGARGKKKSWETLPVIRKRWAQLLQWRSVYVRHCALLRWVYTARRWRRRGRTLQQSDWYFIHRGMRKALRALLGLRRQRRRERQLDCYRARIMIHSLIRKAVHKLDLHASGKWAQLQKIRLVTAHSDHVLLSRGWRVLENNYASQFKRHLVATQSSRLE
jgi:hypothetical protein